MVEKARTSRALLGFMGEAEAFNFLKGNSILENTTEDKLREIVKTSRTAAESLAKPDLGAEILEIDDKYKGDLEAVTKNPVFPEAIGQRKWSFKLIEIDKLVCFQMYVDTEYSDEMGEKLDKANLESVIDFCLPTKPMRRQVGSSYDPFERVHTLFSSTMDFRVIGPAKAIDPVTKRQSFGFTIGWGVPFVLVTKFQDRYFLRNGYHRVYMLRKNGVRHAACILTEGETYEDTGAAKPGFFPPNLLLSDKPPTFASFFSDQVAPEIRMHPQTKIIRVKVDEFALPLSSPLRKVAEQVEQVTKKAGQAEDPPAKFEDFTIQKEDWNVYRLADGTILKLRQLLVKLRSEPTETPGETTMQMDMSNLLMASFSPKEMQGPPSTQQYSPQVLVSSIVEKDIKYTPTREVTNEYLTSSGIKLLLQLASVNVAKTDKFDGSGEPVYVVNAQVGIQIVGPQPSG